MPWPAILLALLAFALLAGAPRFVPQRYRTAVLVLTLALAVSALLLHSVEADRWQLRTLDALAFLAVVVGLWKLRRREPAVRGRLRLAAGGLGAALLVGLALLPIAAFPVFELPRPRGPHTVGVSDLHLVDQSREDPFRSRPSGRRELMVRAWYPARAPGSAEPPPYLSRRTVDSLVSGRLPVFFFGHLAQVRTHASPSAPLLASPNRLPVVVFVPGFRSFIAQNTALAEDLASHGYVVLSLGAPGDASAVEFPDGQVATFKRDALLNDRAGTEAMAAAMQASDPAEVRRLAQVALDGMPNADKALRLQVRDVRFLLDRIENGGFGALDGRLDPARVGVMGMSLGGAVAGQVCHEDRRCRAGANLDGFQFGDLLGQEVGAPFLLLSSDHNPGPLVNDPMYRGAVRPAGAPALETFRVRGARHLDFTDLTLSTPLLKRVAPNPALGSVAGERMIVLTADVVRAFFDEQLGGRSGALARVVGRWPEVVRHDPVRGVSSSAGERAR